MSHDFPTLSEVVAMHARLIEVFGDGVEPGVPAGIHQRHVELVRWFGV